VIPLVVINIFGSPCSGKSTTAAGVFYLLKQMGKNVEMSLEYVKDCVYDGNKYPFTDQIYVFANMLKRLRQYDGKVDFVVTDAPLLMNHIYGTNESCEFHRLVDVEFNLQYSLKVIKTKER
jgi:tRNA uridine 5-carbamoylmethylation protein Kti12